MKPCPFCGGKAEIRSFHAMHEWSWWPECADCGICGPDQNTEAEAVAYWDTRPGEEALHKEMSTMRPDLGYDDGQDQR